MRGRLKKRLLAAILSILLIMALQVIFIKIPEEVSAFTLHDPIYISGNGDFVLVNGVTGGSGTPLDPYIIEGWEINASSAIGIDIRNTNAYFVIRDSYVHSGGSSYSGIYLFSVQNGSIENVRTEYNLHGIYLHASSNNSIVNNNASSNNLNGIYLRFGSDNNNIADNNASLNVHGILLTVSSNNTLTNNTMVDDGIFILGGLEDWNTHSIDTTNTVNGKPVFYRKNMIGGSVPLGAGEVIIANCISVTVENQNVSNGSVGILVGFSSMITIFNNTASSNNRAGIYIRDSSSNIITNNNASSNGQEGIYIRDSNSNTIADNTILNNNIEGILLGYSSSNTLTNNTMVDDGIFIGGSLLEHWNTHTIDTANTVNGKPVYYWKNTIGGTVPQGAGEVILANCMGVNVENQNVSDGSVGIEIGFSSKITIANNTASNDWFGILLAVSSNNTVINNTALNNWYGISLSSPSNTVIVNNTASSNSDVGIFLNDASNNIIVNNTASHNRHGIYLGSSSNNTIANNNVSSNNLYGIYVGGTVTNSINNRVYHNNIINNTNQAYDNTAGDNQWDDGYPSGGNYWSDYTGIDRYSGPNQDILGSDDIGDTSYDIDSDSEDCYPLMCPIGFILLDLEVAGGDIVFNPLGPVLNGTVVTINATIHNIGCGDAYDVTVRFYDGNPGDPIGSGPGIPIDVDQFILKIPVGENQTVQVQWVATPIGSHDIYVVVDPDNTIDEWNKTNNVAYKTIEVTNPDYTLWNSSPLPKQKISVGSPVAISSQVKNVGLINATVESTIAFYNQSALPFMTCTIPPLNASETSSEYNATWIAPTTPGIYYMIIEADYGNVIEELNETNNTYVIEFNVTEKPITLPDYILWDAKPLPPQQEVSVGSSVVISSQVKNIGVGNATVESNIAFYNQSDLPFKTYTVLPLNISEVSIEFNAIWTAPTTPGTYNVIIKADYYNDIEELDEDNNTYLIEFIVTDKPITAIHIGTPQIGTTPRYVNSSTQFWFSVIDPSNTGYNTHYYVDTLPWNLYTGMFTVPMEGAHIIYFNSTDNLGGIEDTKEFEIIVDNTPPTTAIDIGNPKYISSDILVTSTTEFILSATDGGLIPVGLNYTKYRVWNGTWSNWGIYLNEFTLGINNGTRYVEWYSVDYLGNEEMTHNGTYFVDNIPPITTYILQLEDGETEARISLFSNDEGSGVNFTKYRIGSGDWMIYSSTFMINESGWHTIYFWSVDNLGNAENEKNFSVLIEEPGITIPPPSDGEKDINYKPLIALIFTIILLLVGTYVSHKKSLKFRGKEARHKLYTWLFAVLPFVIAETLTGVISLVTGLLSFPPLLGAGLAIDLAILIAGLIAFVVLYKKH